MSSRNKRETCHEIIKKEFVILQLFAFSILALTRVNPEICFEISFTGLLVLFGEEQNFGLIFLRNESDFYFNFTPRDTFSIFMSTRVNREFYYGDWFFGFFFLGEDRISALVGFESGI